MRHTKFRGNQSTGSREEDFWRVFTIYGHGGHLANVTTIVSINFHFLVPESLHIKFGFDWPSGFWEKPVLIFKCKWPWTKVKKGPWPSILTYLHYLNRFQVTGCSSSEKSKVFTFFYRNALVTKGWPCHEIGQGQPRVIIWTNYDGQESPMLHTKFCGNRSTGSWEENFWRVFIKYGCGSHFGHVTSIMSINFHFLEPESLHIKFGFDWPSGFWEKPVLSFICNWLWVKVKKWPWPSIYSHVFIILCNFRSQAAKVLKNQQFSLFPIEKP